MKQICENSERKKPVLTIAWYVQFANRKQYPFKTKEKNKHWRRCRRKPEETFDEEEVNSMIGMGTKWFVYWNELKMKMKLILHWYFSNKIKQNSSIIEMTPFSFISKCFYFTLESPVISAWSGKLWQHLKPVRIVNRTSKYINFKRV